MILSTIVIYFNTFHLYNGHLFSYKLERHSALQPPSILTHIAFIPNHGTMTVLQTELNANTMIIPSDQIPLGHLSLMMLPAKYAVLEPNNYIIHTNLGTGTAVAAGTSAAAIGDTHWAHNVNKRAYVIYITTDKALKL